MSDEEAPISGPRSGAVRPIFGRPIRVVNIGLDRFAQTLEGEDFPVISVEVEVEVAVESERLARILEALS
jgi:hypothetical protein